MEHKNRKNNDLDETGVKTCLVTKEKNPRAEMLRFVVSPDRTVVFDVAGKLPGRGLWLKSDRIVLDAAITKRLFCKAAKGTVDIPLDLSERVECALRQRVIERLTLARKAGVLVFGLEGVKKEVLAGRVFAAIEAMEGSKEKLFRETDNFVVYTMLTRDELGRIAGQNQVVYAVLLKGKAADAAQNELRKLALFLGRVEQKGM